MIGSACACADGAKQPAPQQWRAAPQAVRFRQHMAGMARRLKLLATAPLAADYVDDWTRIGADVTTLRLDGTVDNDDGTTVFDGAFISAEAFVLFFTPGKGKAALCALYDAVAALVDSGRVKWVHLCASGMDVPIFFSVLRACVRNGAAVTHCPGVYARPMGEYVLGHMLNITRRIPEHAANQRARAYKPLMQKELSGCAVAVLGAGGIGSEVARLAKAFGMRVVGMRRSPAPQPNFDAVLAAANGLEDVVRDADFVVVSMPLTPATRHIVDAKALATMKQDAYLINVSRGGVVDEAALVAALQPDAENGIAGAVLDVFAAEPLPRESPLWEMPNVTITPHDSYKTTRAAVDNHKYWIDNVERVAKGEAPVGAVAQEFLDPALEAAA